MSSLQTGLYFTLSVKRHLRWFCPACLEQGFTMMINGSSPLQFQISKLNEINADCSRFFCSGFWEHQSPGYGQHSVTSGQAEGQRPKPPKIKYGNNNSSLRQKQITCKDEHKANEVSPRRNEKESVPTTLPSALQHLNLIQDYTGVT